MQYNITIDESNTFTLSTKKKIDYTYKSLNNKKKINDLLFLNLEDCNLNFNKMTLLIVGDNTNILEYMNQLIFNKVIMTSNIDDINFNDINCIFNITNDIKITRLLDTKSFQYNLPFFDCNIDNYKLAVHSVIPFITDSSSMESLYQEKSYLLCMLTSFPTEYDHTIKWAIDMFDKIKCNTNLVNFAYNMFTENYNNKIKNLLATIEDETWESKCNKPTPLIFDIDLIKLFQKKKY